MDNGIITRPISLGHDDHFFGADSEAGVEPTCLVPVTMKLTLLLRGLGWEKCPVAHVNLRFSFQHEYSRGIVPCGLGNPRLGSVGASPLTTGRSSFLRFSSGNVCAVVHTTLGLGQFSDLVC